jgi:hypothetical protein
MLQIIPIHLFHILRLTPHRKGNFTNILILRKYAYNYVRTSAMDDFGLWFMRYDALGTDVLDQLTVLVFTLEAKLKAVGLSKALITTSTNKHSHNTHDHTENFHSYENLKYHASCEK